MVLETCFFASAIGREALHYPPFLFLMLSIRPCAMVVPDYMLIAEIMLVAEGFIDARILSRKFLSLYTLCKDLLSKQDHYDWGLRAIKSVLVVAGALKRGDKGRPEDQVRKERWMEGGSEGVRIEGCEGGREGYR